MNNGIIARLQSRIDKRANVITELEQSAAKARAEGRASCERWAADYQFALSANLRRAVKPLVADQKLDIRILSALNNYDRLLERVNE